MERKRGRLTSSLVLAAVVALLAAGCGGSSDSSSTATSSSSTASADSEGSTQFLKSGGDPTIVKFGEEASASEREAANSVLQANLRARAAADFATQCSTLNRKTQEELVGPVKVSNPAAKCPSSLRELAVPLSGTKKVRANTLNGPIAALRVKGDRGWALYHGKGGKDYAMLMEKEAVGWKVGALLSTEL